MKKGRRQRLGVGAGGTERRPDKAAEPVGEVRGPSEVVLLEDLVLPRRLVMGPEERQLLCLVMGTGVLEDCCNCCCSRRSGNCCCELSGG